MKNIMWFKELSKASLAEAGGKGANLGEMYQQGFPIPNGFVTTSGAYFKFIDANNLREPISKMLGALDVNDSEKLQETAEKIKQMIINGRIPDDIRADIIRSYKELSEMAGREVYVAVRSSATAEDLPTASFAGQQATFLNVRGAENTVEAVKKCWASLFEPRAIFYRVQNRFDHMKVGLAAVVQMMVQSEKAGVVFTVDPMTQDRNRMSIEAAYGLGEVVVSGLVTPDTYVVDKRDLKIIDKKIAKQTWMIAKIEGENRRLNIKEEAQSLQKLSDLEIRDLAKMCIKIEEHYESPQDIEYAFERGNLYIVQARPITTLKKKEEEAVPAQKQAQGQEAARGEETKILARGLGASPGIGVGPVKIIKSASEIKRVEKGDVLVTEMTTPDYVPGMKRAAAIVTDTGGMTSHAAIVSRELGVPCVVGAAGATGILKEGELISVDGSSGIVYSGALEAKKEETAAAVPLTGIGPITGTKIYVNLADVDQAERVAKLPVDGVGLLRAEFMIANIGVHPKKMMAEGRADEYVNRLAEGIRRFAAAFYPRPVVYRATDFKTNEYRSLEGGEQYEPKEENPMMGYRGASRYINEPEVFELELRALKKVRDEYHLKNLWLMIPFVRRIGELRAIKELLHKVGIYRTRDFKLWIMVEVPSTVFLIDLFCKEGIDGISIGSNDLTQLILGIDRDNTTLAKGFDERNDAVLRAIRHVVETCRRFNVTTSVCGQAPSVYPEFAEKLVEFGVTSMSVNPDAIERTRQIVASAEQKIILKRLAQLAKSEDKDDLGSIVD